MKEIFDMWTDSSVFYQFYPLGFCGAPLNNDGIVVPRIRKVMEWTDYLAGLHVNAVYFSPVFESDSHGYDTRDYSRIDARLGTNQDFADVCHSLHDKNIRVVLDGVFNHVGRGFRAFQDVLKNRENSLYKDWFYIRFDQNNAYNDGFSYEGWEGHYELVRLNLKNPQVEEHLFTCIRDWVSEYGIDGLRLDVAYCLDADFLRRLRTFCDSLKPEFLLLGEVLFGDYNRLVNDEMLHSCTNYECCKGLYSSFNELNMFEIAYSLNRQFGPENWTVYKGKHLLSFADNHDLTRLASIIKDKRHLPLVYAMMFGMPGVPCIYYGSEWGAEGVKESGSDAALRPCFDRPVENELTGQIRKMAGVYRNSPALYDGDYRQLAVTNRQFVFERNHPEERIIVAVNASGEAYTAHFAPGMDEAEDLLSGQIISLSAGLEIPPYSSFWLKKNKS